MSWQAKGIGKKQSEEKIYKRGAVCRCGFAPFFIFIAFYKEYIYLWSFVVAMGRFEMLTHFSTPRLQLPLTYIYLYLGKIVWYYKKTTFITPISGLDSNRFCNYFTTFIFYQN